MINLEIINQKLIDESLAFLKNISKQDKVCVIHHTDPDGVSSGVILAKAVERLRGKKIDLRHNQKGSLHSFSNETIELLKKNAINKLLVIDIGPEDNLETLTKAAEFAEILIVDHHQISNQINNKRVIMYKPQLVFSDIQPSRYCASKLAYDLCSRIVDLSDLDWVASIGIIGDIASLQWKEFLEGVFKKYNIKTNKDDWFHTNLGRVASIINSADCFGTKYVKQSFEVLYAAKSYKSIFNSILVKYEKIIGKEINYLIKNVDKKAEIHSELELIYYEIKSKHNVKSAVSTVLSFKCLDKTLIVVGMDDPEEIVVSARRQDQKVKMNELMKYAIKDIPGAMGGGHIPASGATVSRKYYPEFKRRVFEYLKNG